MPQVKKGTACAWGVGASSTTSYGRIINFTHRKIAQKVNLMDQDGDIATTVYHGAENFVDAEILPITTSYTTPTIGQTVVIADTIGDAANSYFHVDEVSAVQAVGDAARINVTLSQAPDITE